MSMDIDVDSRLGVAAAGATTGSGSSKGISKDATPKKRGRPRKDANQSTPITTPTVNAVAGSSTGPGTATPTQTLPPKPRLSFWKASNVETPSTSAPAAASSSIGLDGATPTPKQRGRPRKSNATPSSTPANPKTPSAAVNGAATPLGAVNPVASSSADPANTIPAPKKRGRPKKDAATPNTTVANGALSVPTANVEVTSSAAMDATASSGADSAPAVPAKKKMGRPKKVTDLSTEVTAALEAIEASNADPGTATALVVPLQNRGRAKKNAGATADPVAANAAAGSSTGPGTAAGGAVSLRKRNRNDPATVDAQADGDGAGDRGDEQPSKRRRDPAVAARAAARMQKVLAKAAAKQQREEELAKEKEAAEAAWREQQAAASKARGQAGRLAGKAYVDPIAVDLDLIVRLEEARAAELKRARAAAAPPGEAVSALATAVVRAVDGKAAEGEETAEQRGGILVPETQPSQAPNGQGDAAPPDDEKDDDDDIEDDEELHGALTTGARNVAIHRQREHNKVLMNTIMMGLAPTHPLPTKDLLLSLHAHASHFFVANEVLRCPRPVAPKTSKDPRRTEIAEDIADRARGEFRSQYRFGRRIVEDEPEMSSYDLARAQFEADKHNPAYARKDRVDMHTACEGSALLAFGVLVEEMVRHELKLSGYAARGPDGAMLLLEGEEDYAPVEVDKKRLMQAEKKQRKKTWAEWNEERKNAAAQLDGDDDSDSSEEPSSEVEPDDDDDNEHHSESDESSASDDNGDE